MAENPRFSRKFGNSARARNLANARANVLEIIDKMPNLLGDEITNESFKRTLANRTIKLADGTRIKTRREGGVNRVRVNEPPREVVVEELKPTPFYDTFMAIDCYNGNFDFVGYWCIPIQAFAMGNGFFVPALTEQVRLHYANKVNNGLPRAIDSGKKYMELQAHFDEYKDTIQSGGGQVGAVEYINDRDPDDTDLMRIYIHPPPIWSATGWFHEGYDDCHGDWTQTIQMQGHGWYFADSGGLWTNENLAGWGQHFHQYGTCGEQENPMNPLAKTIGSCTYDACTVYAKDKMDVTGTATHYGIADSTAIEHRNFEYWVKTHPFRGPVTLHSNTFTNDVSRHFTGPSGGSPPLFYAFVNPKSVTLNDPTTYPHHYIDVAYTEEIKGFLPSKRTNQGWKSETEHGYVWGEITKDRVLQGSDDEEHRNENFWYKDGVHIYVKSPSVGGVPLTNDTWIDTWIDTAKVDGVTHRIWSGPWATGGAHTNPWYYSASYSDNGYYKVNEGEENEYRVWFMGSYFYRYKNTPYEEENLGWKFVCDIGGTWQEINLDGNGRFHSEWGGYIIRGDEAEDAPTDVYFIGLNVRLLKSEPE